MIFHSIPYTHDSQVPKAASQPGSPAQPISGAAAYTQTSEAKNNILIIIDFIEKFNRVKEQIDEL